MTDERAFNVWSTALDAVEAHLTATQAALDAHETPRPLRTTLPVDPFPAELADRARALIERAQRIETSADQRLDRLRIALRSVPAHRQAGPRPQRGSFIDVGA